MIREDQCILICGKCHLPMQGDARFMCKCPTLTECSFRIEENNAITIIYANSELEALLKYAKLLNLTEEETACAIYEHNTRDGVRIIDEYQEFLDGQEKNYDRKNI